MKVCLSCQENKEDSEYYTKNGRLYSKCKKCFNIYCGERWINRKIDMMLYKGGECVDCQLKATKENYYLFDFHHLNSSSKEMNWDKARQISLEDCKKEIDKCALLCCMCHRTRHFLET